MLCPPATFQRDNALLCACSRSCGSQPGAVDSAAPPSHGVAPGAVALSKRVGCWQLEALGLRAAATARPGQDLGSRLSPLVFQRSGRGEVGTCRVREEPRCPAGGSPHPRAGPAV